MTVPKFSINWLLKGLDLNIPTVELVIFNPFVTESVTPALRNPHLPHRVFSRASPIFVRVVYAFLYGDI